MKLLRLKKEFSSLRGYWRGALATCVSELHRRIRMGVKRQPVSSCLDPSVFQNRGTGTLPFQSLCQFASLHSAFGSSHCLSSLGLVHLPPSGLDGTHLLNV